VKPYSREGSSSSRWIDMWNYISPLHRGAFSRAQRL